MTDGVAPAGDGIVLPLGSPYSYVYHLHFGGIGHIALASKDRHGRFQQCMSKFESCLEAVTNLDEERDWYLSPNAFRAGNRRRASDVVSVRASWIDLDFYKSEMKDLEAEDVWKKAHSLLKQKGIPIPQMVVSTGRGLQLLWLFPGGLPAAIEPRWSSVQRSLIEIFGDFGADRLASNICGVLRIPGTVNSKSGKQACFVHFDLDSRTNFDELARVVTPLRRPKEAQLQIRDARQDVVRRSPLRAEENRKTAAAIVRDIQCLVHGRGFGHEPKTSQDRMLFIFGHFLRRAVGRDAFWDAFMHLADAMTGLTAREKRATAKSVLTFKGRYSSVGAASHLGVTEDDVEKYGLKRLLPAGARNDKERRERRLERRRQHQARTRRLKGQRPQIESFNAIKPWERWGVSKASYYRHLKRSHPDI